MEFGAELAKRLEDIDVDQLWGEVLAQVDASKNPEASKLAGPLHHAAQSGYKPMCKLILTQCKCDVNAVTIDGNCLSIWLCAYCILISPAIVFFFPCDLCIYVGGDRVQFEALGHLFDFGLVAGLGLNLLGL
jgi:hypothetical protein